MDLSQFKDLSIAGLAIVSFTYVCFWLIKLVTKNQDDYRSFVQDNNHTTTDLVRESTATMVEVKNTIANHNELLKLMIDKQK